MRWAGAAIVYIIVLLSATPLPAQVQDTVVLRSGRWLVGEAKSLQRGSLSFDTDEMDVVEIDWDKIALLTSTQFFDVALSSGDQFFGSLASVDTAMLVIAGAARADTVAFEEVVLISPIARGFFARTRGYVDVGTNLARANRLASLLLSGQFNYRGPKWGANLTADLYRQRQESIDDSGDTSRQTTSRSKAVITGSRFLGGLWAVTAVGGFEENQELELESRLLGVLAGQYKIIRNQGLELYAAAGGGLNDEQYVGEDRATSGEVFLQVGFDAFDVGNVDINTTLTSFVRPSDGGRFRVNFDGRIVWEIVSDLTVGLTITERLDSRPPSADAEKRDYQYSVTIGWSWR